MCASTERNKFAFISKKLGGVPEACRRLLFLETHVFAGMLRWVRSPRIKYQKIKVPHEVIKEIPGPERIVYTEVPKEVIKNEIVYVPLYSIDEGTIQKGKNIKPKKEENE